MSNALRLFIRESLTSEAVGNKKWIDPDPYKRNSIKDSSATSAVYKWLTGKLGNGWGVTKAAVGKVARTRKGKAGAAAGIAAAGVWFMDWWNKKPEAGNDPAETAEDKLDEFEEKIKSIISNNQKEIIEAFRTPTISSGLDTNSDAAAMTRVIDEYIANYTAHTATIIAAANSNYDGFFTKIMSYSRCRNALNTAIDKASGSDQNAISNFKSYTFNFLVYSAISFSINTDATDPVSASGSDLSALTSADFIKDNNSDTDRYQNFIKIKNASVAISEKINNDPKCNAILSQFEDQ
jgi:hypothetical protein